MNVTNLDKGVDYDRDGRNLANWASTTQPITVSIIDNGDATIENFYGIFMRDTHLTSADLTQMNLENVTTIHSAFENCYGLEAVYLNSLPNCTNFRAAFCRTNLRYMPIPRFSNEK